MKRRHFLSTSAFAGAFALAPNFSRAASSANGDLRVCLIGFHSRGKELCDDLLKCKGAKLVALCDVDSDILDSYAAELDQKGIKVTKYDDYRKVCEAKDIDAVIIATPNHLHTLIATTAAANGKHAYVEKPVSHNVWEGRQLAIAAEKYKTIIQHGFQRRSETSWNEAFDFINTGEIGKITLARGFCYRDRPSIGKVGKPIDPPKSVNYDLWCGPREVVPVARKQFHYDWHWQFPYGSGDLGNQGCHQLDVCRRAIGDPKLPTAAISVGARLGYNDDGQWANTQICYFDYPVPILFEMRGLPSKDYKGLKVGNIIEYEGGSLSGGNDQACEILDKDGKTIKSFKGKEFHVQRFVDSCHSGKIEYAFGAENGHLSAALSHVGNISWKLGKATPPADIKEAIKDANTSDAVDRMLKHLEDNKVDPNKDMLALGKPLTIDPDKELFTGEFAEEANPMLKDSYRKGFELPV